MADVELPTKALGKARRSLASAGLILIALWLNVIVQCVSLLLVTERYDYFGMYFNLSDPGFIILSAVLFLCLSGLFVLTEFSFGYIIGFNFFVIVMDFVWLSHYSRLRYEHDLAAVFIVVSFLLFLWPALLMGLRVPRSFEVSATSFSLLLNALIVLLFGVLIGAAGYNFRVAGLDSIYEFREQINLPTLLNYAVNNCINAVGPFVFACQVERRNYLSCLVICALLLAYYPVTLSKGALFAPFWLIALALVMHSGNYRFRMISLLVTMFFIGVVCSFSDLRFAFYYFGSVNFRLFAVPASVIEHYLEYFQLNPTTGFCHVGFLQPYLNCLNTEQLSVIMNERYGLGNQNGSLFATEGVAAFGFHFMPVVGLVSGALIAVGNAASAGLSGRFVVVSSGMLPLALNNVPISIALLTGGYLLLVLLWAITAKSSIENDPHELTFRGEAEVTCLSFSAHRN